LGRVANAPAVAVAAKVAAQHGAMHREEEVACVEQAPPESQRASYNSFSDTKLAKSPAHSAKQYQDANSAHIHYNRGGDKTEIKSEPARSSVSPDPVGWLLRVIGDAAASFDGDEKSKEEKSLESYEIRKCARQEARCTESVSPSGPEGMEIYADASAATDGLCNGEARGVRRGMGHNLWEKEDSERWEFLKSGARDVVEWGGAVIVARNTFRDRAKTPREDHPGRLQSPSARRISHFDSKSPRAEAREKSPYREEEADEYGEIPIFIGEEETTTHTATTQNATQTATLVALQNMLMDKGETHEKGIDIKQLGHDGCESKK